MQNRLLKNFVKRSFSFVICIAVLSSVFSAHAQKQTVKASINKQASQKCNGGWSGFVTYEKTLKYKEDFGKQKRLPHGTTHNKLSHDYTYAGRITVDGSQGVNYLKTKSQLSLNDIRRSWKRSDQIDTCFYDGKKEGVPQWTEKTESDITNAFGEGEAGFSLNVDQSGGTYYFSFIFPEADGTNERIYDKTAGGWCNPKFNEPENKTTKFPDKISGLGADITDQKIDTKNPDVLSGSKIWEEKTTLESSRFVYKVSWSFRRCPAPLELETVEFDEHPYPDWNAWRRIDGETIDGNIVRVRARVTNYSNETKFPQLKFTEQRANVELPDSERSISIAPGESRDVEYLWDTSGWAWEIGGFPASDRAVKVDLTEPTSPSKTLSADVLIVPRPVILAHGLWADYTSWDGYDKFFKQAHSASWNSYAVGADPRNGVMNTGEKGTWKPSNSISQNATELQKQIEAVRRNNNAWHVDAVVHSMGGLIAREYVHFLMDTVADGKPALTRLIQLGTPNMGSPCANLMGFTFWSLGKPVQSLEQLRPAFLERFNKTVRNRKGTKFSVLVGNPLPQTCQSSVWGDGVVEIPSAIWEINDYRYSRSVHTDLTSKENFEYFVWRRLAVSWRGDHKPDNGYRAVYENSDDEKSVDFVNAAFDRNGNDEKPSLPENLKLDLAKEVVVRGKQTTEIEILVTANANSGVTFAASPQISVNLLDEKGAIVGKSLAGTPEAATDFRSLPIESQANGVWKLRLENTGTRENSVVISVWTDTSANRFRFSIEAGKPNANGQIPLTAKLSENNSPVSGASVKAQIIPDDGKFFTLTLFDDGTHGDGAANDGIYGATTEKLADGTYSVTAKAEISEQLIVAADTFSIGKISKVSSEKKAKK